MAKNHNPRFVAFADVARSRIRETNVEKVRQRLDGGEEIILADVREESEWATSRIPTAIRIGKGIIERDIEARVPNLDTPIVLYCGGGYRLAIAADALNQMGYTYVESMEGGFSGWDEAGFDVGEGNG